jgi:hypothetical protein
MNKDNLKQIGADLLNQLKNGRKGDLKIEQPE